MHAIVGRCAKKGPLAHRPRADPKIGRVSRNRDCSSHAFRNAAIFRKASSTFGGNRFRLAAAGMIVNPIRTHLDGGLHFYACAYA
jgi:hypothetical protein